MDEEFDLRKMPEEELALVPFDLMEWRCQGKACSRKAKVKTYGDFPFFRWRGKWLSWEAGFPSHFFMCPKHYKMWKRLTKSFSTEKVFARIMKPYKMTLFPIEPKDSK